MSRRPPSLPTEELVAGILAGNRTVLGRAVTLVESERSDHQAQAQELLQDLLAHTGRAHRVGVTGIPGVGKSTFIESLGLHLLEGGRKVAVLAVDPTSQLSGGSILGDKTRMPQLGRDPRAFVRPSPTRGCLGGVASKTRETILLVEAAGFDVVLVETVGVGQSETLAADMVDSFLVLLLAGAGDQLQGIKRGILELADVLAITKADGENLGRAEQARQEFTAALRYLPPRDAVWRPRVVTCSSLENRGIAELWQLLEDHRSCLAESGGLEARRRQQQLHWMWALVKEGLERRLRDHPTLTEKLPELEAEVSAGRLTPTLAARRILELFG